MVSMEWYVVRSIQNGWLNGNVDERKKSRIKKEVDHVTRRERRAGRLVLIGLARLCKVNTVLSSSTACVYLYIDRIPRKMFRIRR